MQKNKTLLIVGALVMVATATLDARAQGTSATERAQGTTTSGFSLGPVFDYSTGKYGGTAATDVWSLGVVGRYETGPWTFRLTVPYVNVRSPGNVVPSGSGSVTPVCRVSNSGPGNNTGIRCDDNSSSSSGGSSSSSGSSGRRSDSGLGDVTAGVTYNLLDNKPTGLVFDLTGKVKIPTADENKGLGSGKFDYSIQGDIDKTLGNANVFGTLGYKIYGEPAGTNLRNVVFAGVGTSYRLSRAATWGVAYDFRQASFSGGKSLNEISLFTSYRVTDATRLRGYVFKGLTDGGPDWGVGASVLFSF